MSARACMKEGLTFGGLWYLITKIRLSLLLPVSVIQPVHFAMDTNEAE